MMDRIFLLFVAVIAAPVNASEGRRLEISPDGAEVVELGDQAERTGHGNPIGGIAGSAVPYGTTPDWQNTLRRQVASVNATDIDGDGDVDLIVGCYISQSFPPYDDWHNMIYRNIGGQLEANPSWISADQVHTGEIQVADFNLDGFKDIFSANGGSSMSPSVIYFGGPGGPSTTPGWQSVIPGNTWATSAFAFDFDHDGDTDVVTTNQSPIQSNPYRPIYMFRNNAGVLESTPSWQSAEASIQNGLDVGDYDGDGWEDLAVAKWVNFQCSIYKSINGTLQTTPVWTNGSTEGGKGAAFGDLDNDGRLDVLFGLDPARLYSQLSPGAFTNNWTSTAPVPSAQEIRLIDVDLDGDKDFVEIHFSTGRCHLYLNNNGVLASAPSWTYDAAPVGTAVTFGDINDDGCPDLIIGYSGLPSVVVFYAQCPERCPADITGNGIVNVDDLLSVISNWGATGSNPADINNSGAVNVDDLLAVINAWGPCS